jgi:hypothetical protein
MHVEAPNLSGVAIFAKGKKALFSEIEASLEGLAETLPQMVADSLREQVLRIKAIMADMQRLSGAWHSNCVQMSR